MFGRFFSYFGYGANNTEEEENSQPTADELRELRINRFTQQNAGSPTSAPPTITESDHLPNQKQRKIEKEELPTPELPKESPPQEEPFPSPVAPTNQPQPQIVLEKKEEQHVQPALPTKSPPQETTTTTGNTTIWEDKIIRRVFGVTLQPEQQSTDCNYLPEVVKNLQKNNQPRLLSTSLLDQIIVEQIERKIRQSLTPLKYLVQCSVALSSEMRCTRSNKQRNIIFQEIQDIIVNYCALILAQPELIELSADISSILGAKHYHFNDLLHALNDSAVPTRLLSDLFDRLKEDGHLAQVVIPLLEQLRLNSRGTTLNDSYPTEITGIFTDLLNDKDIAIIAISDASQWLTKPGASGRSVEELTYLGSLLSFSVVPTRHSSDVMRQHFMNPMSRRDFEGIRKSFQTKIDTIVKTMHSCLMNMFRTCKEPAQQAVLAWLAQILEGNRELLKSRPNTELISGMGLAFNVSYLCFLLCEPIITKLRERAFPKIDPAYLQSGVRLDVSSETKLSVNSKELESWVDKRNQSNIETWKRQNPGIEFDPENFKKTERAGFTTEIFFLTYRALHLGFIKGQQQLRDNFHSVLREQRERRDRIRETNDAAEIARIEATVKTTEAVIECYLVHLFDVDKIKAYSQFYLFAARWLLHLIDPEGKGLPLSTPSMEYGSMPEFIVEDIAEFFLITVKICPDIPLWFPLNDLVPLFVLLLGSPPHVKNPYLRAKLLELLAVFVDSRYTHHAIALAWLESDKIAVTHLATILMRFYIDIEKTGHHNQFVHKFTVRQQIQVVLKQMWSTPQLHESIVNASNVDHFVHFISKVLDDALFLLEEGLQTLHEIRTLQQEMKDTDTWNSLSEAAKSEKREEHEKAEKRARSLFLTADGTVDMLQYLTTEIIKPFMSPELVGRIANMLNYFLEQLVGPKCTQLAVENREKLSFHPKKILGTLVDIYLNLWQPEFVKVVSKDTRCYSHNAFIRARDIMSKTGIRPPSICSKIEQFANDVLETADTSSLLPDDVEIPEHMLDPLMNEIMVDPMKLPSGMVIDRQYIVQHLLIKETDPFTNLPLTLKDLVPHTELKAEIEEFIRKHSK